MRALLVVAALSAGAPPPPRPAPKPMEWTVDGVKREALVFAPSPPPGSPAKAPAIFAFHGHGGDMREAARMNLQQLWPEAVVVYMQGLPTSTPRDPQGTRPGWQTTP